MHAYNKLFLKIISLILVLIVVYFCIVDNITKKDKYVWDKTQYSKNATTIFSTINLSTEDVVNVWFIFTKVTEGAPLQIKFQNLLKSIFTFNSVPLHLHVICDENSKLIAEMILSETRNISKQNVQHSVYDVNEAAQKINDIVITMTPHFSSQPGTYYSDALFYLSLGLHRIAPVEQSKAIMLDCDVQFTKDILYLYKEFESFRPENLFGIAHEQTPVYRHILYAYRNQRNTSFGEYVHSNPLFGTGVHSHGFPGYNSGVMLFNLSAIRQSSLYPIILTKENVLRLTKKYMFKGHLGDQDFYTILGYEYPELFKTIPCYFNRQLCVWWRDHGYSAIFGNYSKCMGDVIVYHGNCNTPIPVAK